VVYKSIIQFPQNMLISHVFNYSTWHGIREGKKPTMLCIFQILKDQPMNNISDILQHSRGGEM